MKATIIHLDTCLSCYFSGTRNPFCSAVLVTADTTIGNVIDMLRIDDWGVSEEWTPAKSEALDREIDRLRVELTRDGKIGDPFDSSLEPTPEDYDDESVYAYFVIEWSDDSN